MGWIGTAFTVAGVWRLGTRSAQRSALLLMMVGNLFWIVEASCIQKPDLIVINLVLFCVAARNFRRR